MGDSNKILTAANGYLAVTNIAGTAGSQMDLQGVPLGTVGDSPTGALGVKVIGAGSGGTIPTTPQTTTFAAPALLGASSSQAVPSGAKGWLVSIISGTATVNGTAGIPAGQTISSQNTLATSFTVTTAAASSAVVAWET